MSILENNLVSRLNSAALRIAETQKAADMTLETFETLAAVYDTLDAEAMRSGFSIDDVKKRSRRLP